MAAAIVEPAALSETCSTGTEHGEGLLMKHPVDGYGWYKPGRLPVICNNIKPGYYTVDENSNVYRRNGIKMKPNRSKQLKFTTNNGRTIRRKHYYIAFATFFPMVPYLGDIDHININHNDNHISNLQTLTHDEHGRKSALERPNTSGPAKSKKVFLLDGKEGQRVRTFASLNEAARGLNIKLGTIWNSAISHGRLAARGNYFAYETDAESDLPGEAWTTSPTLDEALNQVQKPDSKKVKVSTLGRVRKSNGVKMNGTKHRAEPDRKINVGGTQWKVHALIYMGFYDKPMPTRQTINTNGERMVISHDDNNALARPHGLYRNFPQDLTLDTHSNNMRSYWKAKKEREAYQKAKNEGLVDAAEISSDEDVEDDNGVDNENDNGVANGSDEYDQCSEEDGEATTDGDETADDQSLKRKRELL
jgi:hypothetical protein